MRVFTAAAPPFMKNGFVIADDTSPDAVMVDPGDEVGELLGLVRASGLRVSAILLTHAHLDHISGVGRAKAALGVPIWLHRDDLFLYNGVVEQGRMFGLTVTPQPPIDRFYEVGVPLHFGSLVVDVRHTPGHCPGGVCLAIGDKDSTERALFVGDTLFAGSIGRTDLPGGDYETLDSRRFTRSSSVIRTRPSCTPVTVRTRRSARSAARIPSSAQGASESHFFLPNLMALLVQAAGALLLAALSVVLYRTARSRALGFWAAAWLSLSLAVTCLWAAFYLGSMRSAAQSVYLFGEYLFGFLLLAGCWTYAGLAGVSKREAWLAIPGVLLA